MYRHTSLCGCLKIRWPVAWLEDELAKRFCEAMKAHYQEFPECWIKAVQDPVWQFRRPLDDGRLQ